MNEQDGQEPGFDDPAYDDVRALLADARATGPVPDDVVARLDATLASLTADRRPPLPDDQEALPAVVPLRRRSRTGSRLLAAAAAVLVVGAGGVGLSEVLRTDGADQMVADSAGAPESGDFGPQSAPELAPADPASPDTGADLTERLSNLDQLYAKSAKVLPRFTSARFPAEAEAFRESGSLALLSRYSSTASRSPAPAVGDSLTDADGQPGSSGAGSAPQPGTVDEELQDTRGSATRDWSTAISAARAACPGPVGITATVIPVRYDGKLAALAIHPATAFGRLFAAWSCDGATLLAWTVVPR